MMALARASGLAVTTAEPPLPPNRLSEADGETMNRWLDTAATWLDLEIETSALFYAQLEMQLRQGGPLFLRLPAPNTESEPKFLAVVRGRRNSLLLLTAAATVEWVPLAAVQAALCQPLEAPLIDEVNELLAQAGVTASRQEQARRAMLRQRLGTTNLGDCWRLKGAPGTSFGPQLRRAGVFGYGAAFVASHALQNGLWLLSWVVIGRGALSGQIDTGWLLAWLLLLLTLVPLRMLEGWLQALLTISAGAVLKRRLLYGAIQLEPEEIRHQGAGQLLGRVIESEAIEWLALTGGFSGLVGAVELVMAGAVLWVGVAGWLHLWLLAGCIGATLWLGWRYYQQHGRLTKRRLEMTHDLVEQMVGYRTRLVQEQDSQRHGREDEALSDYLEASGAAHQTAAWLAVIGRGWLVLAIACLAPSFINNTAAPEMVAISLGGIISAYLAFRKFALSVTRLATVLVGWQQVDQLFQAAARPVEKGVPALAAAPANFRPGQPLLSADGLTFRYQGRGETVLQNCDLSIASGDRLLLEGPSGGGKSTLAALLVGLRRPETGLLLLQGLDRATLGAYGWRRRVSAAPQFHENHVFMGTFAFNLLMGRRWPPRPADMQEAIALCHELGLGELLGRMPAGLLQMVGETGWQLSHGERSRLYIARALLQGSDLVILDESFAALDPETLKKTMDCVNGRAGTLLVIAHP